MNIRVLGLVGTLLVVPSPGLAKKSNQAVYEEPFDLAAGGASLTRASKEGVMFANPALMPYGAKTFRWFGTQMAMIASRESVTFAKSMSSGSGDTGGSEIIDKAFQTPIHFGFTNATSLITNNFGVGVFARFEPDIEAMERGDLTGMPSINISAEGYGGGVVSYAARPVRWFSLGVTHKYLTVAEPNIEVELTDQTRVQELTNKPAKLQEAAATGTGLGNDIGMLFFAQGSHVDFRLAIKVDDIGDTKLSGSAGPFKQVVSTGMAVTFHGTTEALHLSVDYRDILDAYEEKPFKKVYAGAKLLIRNAIGLAAGAYQGIPTVGLRLNMFLIRMGVTAYGREMGRYIDDKQRNLYVGYFGMGF